MKSLPRLGWAAWARSNRAPTKLNRDVALTVLPEAFTLDPDRLARFKREAQVLASLNHPKLRVKAVVEPGGRR
jgi:serine/threonine protein kinase